MDTPQIRPGYVIVIPWEPNYGGGVNEVVINLYNQTLLAGEMKPIIMVPDWSVFRSIEKVSDGRDTVYFRLASPWSESGSVFAAVKWCLSAPIFLPELV